MIFYQLFDSETNTFTYLIGDETSREAAIIDPVLERVDRDLKWAEEANLKLIYSLDTHVHADHVTGAGEIRRRTSAKTAIAESAEVSCVDLKLKDGDKIRLGRYEILALSTPGHTASCMCFYTDGKLFTGDTLFIRKNGRIDFQHGSAEQLYESITQKLFRFPDETLVYPGHDYNGFTASTIGMEKKFNWHIGGERTKAEFVGIMKAQNLPRPKHIDVAVPANLNCGKKETTHA